MTTTLPVLHVEMIGEMSIKSNLKDFTSDAAIFIDSLPKNLETDSDFAAAKLTIKDCQAIEKTLDETVEKILSKTGTVKSLVDEVVSVRERITQNRLRMSKLVKNRESEIKTKLIHAAVDELNEEIKELNKSIKPHTLRFCVGTGAFTEVIKGKKTADSVKKAIAYELTILKARALEEFNLISYNKNLFQARAENYEFLFSDIDVLVYKDRDEFESIVKHRIEGYKLTEQDKESDKLDSEFSGTEYVERPAATFAEKPETSEPEKSQFEPIIKTYEHAAPVQAPEETKVDLSYISAWYELKQDLAKMKQKEMEMRKNIAMTAHPYVAEGTFHTDIGSGYDLVCNFSKNYNIDESMLKPIVEELRKHGINMDHVVKYKPSLSISNYKSLDEKVRNYFDNCLEIKMAAPKIEIKKRNNEI